ncbi:hypothetical protein AB0F17_59855 [Nonomuraea sp. NPDC026600]|uniref:hypothetical protein n=1 Tax=Nonomuraea sp. NPDC026600 TaxID=3155363 RepID=UPI0033F43F5B
MPLPPDEIRRRLAYIRYLHNLGVDQARLPEPLSSASVLMLHDAAEGFLLLAAEHFDVDPPIGLEKFWRVLKPVLGTDLPVAQGMKRLNKIRNTLKHNGGHPDQPTINLVATDTTTFLEASTPLVFQLDYAAVSMADVIPQQPVRDLVRQAETASADGRQVAAMVALVEAFEALFKTPPLDNDIKPLRLGPTINNPLRDGEIARVLYPPEDDHQRRATGRHHELAKQITDATEIVMALQAATRLMLVGIDFAAARRFGLLTPDIDDYVNGRREYRAPDNYAPTPEDVAWCCQFIVTASLRLSAAEAQLRDPYQRVQTWKTIAKRPSPGAELIWSEE